MRVKEIMHAITVVDVDSSVSDVAKLMSKRRIGSVLSIRGDCVKIATERDILTKVVAAGRDPKATKVSEVMSVCSHIIGSDMDVFEASDLLNIYHIRRLPVREEGKIIGIVTARDLAKSLAYIAARRIVRDEEYGRRTFDREGGERPNPSP
jgi:CBS domain-containing protein